MNSDSCAIRLRRKGIYKKKDFLEYSKKSHPNKGGNTLEYSIISSCWDQFKNIGMVKNVHNNGRVFNNRRNNNASTSGCTGNRRSNNGASTSGSTGNRRSNNGASAGNNVNLTNVPAYGYLFRGASLRAHTDVYIYNKPDIFYKFQVENNIKMCALPTIGAGIYSNMTGKKYFFIMLYETSLKKPVAFAEIIGQGNRMEIYNVCTLESRRRSGYATLLMNAITELAKSDITIKDLYLGVLLNQTEENFNSKVKLYAKSGFVNNSNVRNKTFANMNLPHFLMKYDKEELKGAFGNQNKINNTINKSKMYYRNYKKSNVNALKTALIRLTIDQQSMQDIKKYQRTGEKEMGGTITVDSLKFNKTNKMYSTNGYLTNVTNGNEHAFQVFIPNINKTRKAIISWHTHPSICYKKYGACMGTPSIGDWIAYVRYTFLNGQIANFVFAEETIYVCGLRDIAISILGKHKHDKKDVLNTVITEQLSLHLNPYEIAHKSPERHGFTINQSSQFQNGPYMKFVAPNGSIKNAIWNSLPAFNAKKGEEFFNDYTQRLHNITIRSVIVAAYQKKSQSVNTSLHPRFDEPIYDTPVFYCSTVPHNNYETSITALIPYGMYDLKKNLK